MTKDIHQSMNFEQMFLTTYEDFREYINRMVEHGTKNLLSPMKTIYYATSSGTTGKMKFLPIHSSMIKDVRPLTHAAIDVIWSSLSSPYPSPERRTFQLYVGKKASTFQRAHDGTPIGPLSEFISGAPSMPGLRFIISTSSVLSIDLIESIIGFETTIFVQLVFALAIPDLYCYMVAFASICLHTIKIIEKYFEEMSCCIATSNFNQSSLVRDTISDSNLRAKLNQALKEVTIEYGDATYRIERAEFIKQECLKTDISGLLHRLWPSLIYVSTAIGGSFAIYKEKLEFYCGKELPLINMNFYISSEGLFGSIASIYTDEYILSPTSAFFEFIKEEDMHQAQPKTLLLSEIEPGHRYELVCTTEAGLIRYRMGDVLDCTRFLSRADDLVPLPAEPQEIPRIPLVSVAYRAGNLLDINGEKTTEQHLLNALEGAVHQWKENGFHARICDFTAYSKLDTSPPKYIIFVELITEQDSNIDDKFQGNVSIEVEEQLRKAHGVYNTSHTAGKLDSLICILVQSGTFSTFLHKELVTDRVNPAQVKPHRLLKKKNHIEFFYNNRIISSSSLNSIDN
ncbi:hypothetical protein I4U23_015153 [Adineta vaga]|nr:hypothetical protein I4U23_015153 [Adineta vaga]